MKHILGSALEPIDTKSDRVIAHVSNYHLVMGAGFAYFLAKKYPLAAESLVAHGVSMPVKKTLGWNDYIEVEPGLVVCSMVAQTLDHRFPLSMPALEDCLMDLAKQAKADKTTVHLPRIGCGLAGGHWEDIKHLIGAAEFESRTNWYVYTLPNEQGKFPPEKYEP